MEWSEVIDSPYFRDMPFKIEMNKYGSVLMHPRTNAHGMISCKIVRALATHFKKRGSVLCGCSIQTAEGVKVANVAWASNSFNHKHGVTTPFPEAPEICVEIVSASNPEEEMKENVDIH